MKVKAVPVRSSINVRMQTREQLEPYLEILIAPEDRLLRTCIIQTMIETNDLPDESKQEFEKACWLTKMDAASMLALSVQGNMAKLQQQVGAIQDMMGGNPMISGGQDIQQSVSDAPPSEEQIMDGTLLQQAPVEDTTAMTL
jgi:hypothetical protein